MLASSPDGDGLVHFLNGEGTREYAGHAFESLDRLISGDQGHFAVAGGEEVNAVARLEVESGSDLNRNRDLPFRCEGCRSHISPLFSTNSYCIPYCGIIQYFLTLG